MGKCIRIKQFFLRRFPMGTLEKLSFAVAAVGVVLSLGIAKRRRVKKVPQNSDLSDFLDWVDADSDLHDGSDLGFLTPDEDAKSPLNGSDISLHRSLASVGLAATPPLHARAPRVEKTSIHPASGNDELADDVVRLKRISEAEEAERYFSAFSFYSS
jgi:hypothetical protein